MQDRNQTGVERRLEQSLWKTQKEQIQPVGRLGKERRVNLIFAWHLGFLLRFVVWCMCPLASSSKDECV